MIDKKQIKTTIKKVWTGIHPVRDSRRKSLVKALSWRVIGTLDTIALSWIVTGKLTIAVSIGVLELVTKTALYYVHERAWANIEIASYRQLEGEA